VSKFLIGVVTATLALAACGSSSKSSSSGNGSSNKTTTSVSSGSSADIATLAAKAKTSAFKVTYQTSGGDSVTVAQDGNGKVSVIQGGKLYITDGSTTIACDGTTSSATCRDTGSAGQVAINAVTATFDQAYRALTTMKSSLFNGQTSSKTIAGRDASCVTVKLSDMAGIFGSIAGRLAPDASVAMCVDKQTGALLKLAGGSDTDTFGVTATEFGEPSDSDFQPPSTPQSAPATPSFTIPKITLPTG
jgi:hypothetical protein